MNTIDITNATPEQLDYLLCLAAFGITDTATLSTMTHLPASQPAPETEAEFDARCDAFEEAYDKHIEEMACGY